ncbi:MAG TPA: hypothetical protein PLZ51_04290, partial [Aggregatilineales bacterium]|nr:hypothetical protein [Aggregatilineales bacterium]
MKNINFSQQKTLKRLWLIVSVVVLVACSPATSQGENVTYVVITNTPPSLGVIPVQGQELTPTPDMPPEIALQVANRYWIDGYFENAVYAYEALLERGSEIPT